jgi:hypothetical protein
MLYVSYCIFLDHLETLHFLQGLERRKEPGLRALRTIRELQEGMVSNEFFSRWNCPFPFPFPFW